KWLDFNTAYAFKDAQGNELGKIVRKGWRSLWKAEYELIDQHGELQYHIREKNPWVKVMDGFVGEIPIVNFFSGYMFNPAYVLTDLAQKPYAILQKNASFFGRKFTLQKLEEIDADDEARIALGFMMMILLERRRG
ncbi:MAG: hypothetical protein KDD49_01110, partial [Bacteroidetes bacterium]|nr:hypothetical protein [Bacteroidota bacterium]